MTDSPPNRRLADSTTSEIRDQFGDGHPYAVLLPVGSTEAHRPHLPLATDVIIAEETSRRALEELSRRGIHAVAAPAIPYAVTEFVGEFAGTVSVRAETIATLIGEICAALFRQGAVLVCIVNGHLEPEHARMLKKTARALSDGGDGKVIFADQRLPPTVEQLGEEFARGGGHAGGYETSLVLAARSDLVRDDVRCRLETNFVDIAERIRDGARNATEAGGPDAYFGDPAGATIEEGERLYGVLATMVADAVEGAL